MAFFQKTIYVKRKKGEEFYYEKRGVCFGVYVAKKTGTVKFLLCSLDDDKTATLPVGAVEHIHESSGDLYLKNLRTALPPDQYVRLTPFLPVYSCEGKYLGRLDDLFSEGFTVTKLAVGKEKYPAVFIDGASDALLLKSMPYPIGEWSKREEIGVSRKLLKEKIKRGELIRFTLTLPPFEQSDRA